VVTPSCKSHWILSKETLLEWISKCSKISLHPSSKLNSLPLSKCLHPFYLVLFNSFCSLSLLVGSFHFSNSSSIRVCVCVYFSFSSLKRTLTLNHLVKFVFGGDPHWVVTIIVNLIPNPSETYKNICNSQINSYHSFYEKLA